MLNKFCDPKHNTDFKPHFVTDHKNILITGTTGFIGYHLARTLSANNTIYCVVRAQSNLSKLKTLSNLHCIYYDGTRTSLETAIQPLKLDLVYHLASLFIAEHKPENVDDLIDSNIKFPTQLLEVITQTQKDMKFINTGTAWQNYVGAEYNPVCLYAATKQSFEDILKYYHEAQQLSCITLRLYDTYGMEDERKKLIWLLHDLKNTSRSLDMSPGEQRLNLVHIDDVISAYILAGERLSSLPTTVNEVYGVYNQHDYSLKEIVDIFEHINACKLKINWGKREYRMREVMQPTYPHGLVPGWIPKYANLADGFKN